MNKSTQLFLLVITYIVFAVAGYFFPIGNSSTVQSDNLSNIKDKTIEEVNYTAGNTGTTTVDNKNVQTSTNQTDDAGNDAVNTAAKSANAPVIAKASAVRAAKKYKYTLNVKATSENGTDPLECVVKRTESSHDAIATRAITNGQCSIPNLDPTPDGTYYVIVRNTSNNAYEGKIVEGFNQMEKWSKEQVTKSINAEEFPTIYFEHFASTIKFTFTGYIPDPNIKTIKSVDALRNIRSAYDLNYVVTKAPLYDNSNKITALEIQINKNN